MENVVICICTRNRPEGITSLLQSIFALEVDKLNLNIEIVVVENDKKPYSEKLIKELAVESPFMIRYYLESNQGIAYARNRTVQEAGNCDFCCFVDDDQIVAKDWLYELFKCQKEFNSDGVWGPNPPIFKKEVHPSVKLFHMPTVYNYGTIVKSAYTNCLLLKKNYLEKIDGPFDLRLNFTGGEDNYLTWNLIKMGAQIRFNPYAIAYEIVPENRTKLKYIIQRTYRIANEGLYINTLKDDNFSKWNALPRLILRFCFGLILVIPFFLLWKEKKYNGIRKISDSLGGFSFLLGRKSHFYKNS